MPSQCVRFQRQYQAPPQRLFALFSDHERFGKLLGAPCTRIKSAPEGSDPNGVGSVRRIAGGPVAIEETIVTSEAPTLIEYRVTRGGPLRNHFGRIQFNPQEGGGTELVYTIAFDPLLPLTGPAITWVLEQALGRALCRVSRHV